MTIEHLREQLEALLTNPDVDAGAVLAELGYVPASSQEDNEQALATAREEGSNETLQRVCGILDLGKLGGMPDMAKGLIESKASVEEARTKILEAKAKQGSEERIFSTVNPTTLGDQSALVADAKKRAEAARPKV